MSQDTRPAELDSASPGDSWADFRIELMHDRLRLLRELCDGHVPITLNLPDGTAVPSALWAVDGSAQRLSFSTDTDRSALARLVEANEAVAVAYLDSVKLQFDLAGVVLVHGTDHSALHSRMPAAIYRFQRRNTYRVRGGAHVDAVARLRHPGMPDMRLALRVLDVSSGGCALWLPSDVPPLPAGTELHGVQIELDEQTVFVASAVLQHITAVGNGERMAAGARVGCSWKRLPPDAERLLQRWIDRAQQKSRRLPAA